MPPGATLEIDLTLLSWNKVEKVTGERPACLLASPCLALRACTRARVHAALRL